MRRILELGAVALATFVFACGGGDGKPSRETRFARGEECANLAATMPLVRFDPATECPTSGRRCCLASEPFKQCPQGDALCGASGLYEQQTQTIVLPQGCDLAFEHESIHHLLFIDTGDVDSSHSNPLFAACGS